MRLNACSSLGNPRAGSGRHFVFEQQPNYSRRASTQFIPPALSVRHSFGEGVACALWRCVVAMNYARAAMMALVGGQVAVGNASVRIPGTRSVRLSTVMGNRRVHRLMSRVLTRGATVADVGANIGFNTVYAARSVGPSGRVVAVEPAGDNLAVLRSNVERNRLANVVIMPVAAGRARETRDFYQRGPLSAVNSLFRESVYAHVTDVFEVSVQTVDSMVHGAVDLVKIDVEGAELEVLEGMTRLLRVPSLRLVVEWHPLLQETAGVAPGALPYTLLDLGYSLLGATHSSITPITSHDIGGLVERLRRRGRPIDILAERPPSERLSQVRSSQVRSSQTGCRM